MTENYAAVLHGPNNIRIDQIPIPEINDEEVLVKMSCVGICGSDVTMYLSGRCGQVCLNGPRVLGHEGAGTVVKVGANVTGLKAGDRVAVEPTQPCRACAACRRGQYNLCVRPRYCCTNDTDGNMATYYRHVADFCHKIPDNMSLEEGAALQPLGIAMHACARAGVALGDTLVVLGAGPVGLLCACVGRASGAATVLITDIEQSRLDTAKNMGADHTVLVKKEDSDQEVMERIVAALGREPDVTIEASGGASAQRVALMVTRPGGVALVVGICSSQQQLTLEAATLREVDIRGSFRSANRYPSAMAAVASGAVDLKQFITHHFPLEKIQEAMDLAIKREAMKIIVHL